MLYDDYGKRLWKYLISLGLGFRIYIYIIYVTICGPNSRKSDLLKQQTNQHVIQNVAIRFALRFKKVPVPEEVLVVFCTRIVQRTRRQRNSKALILIKTVETMNMSK
mmetsp:Transcript_20832/g.25234  ORF Transcript_20832/g.25234 Transcript_20832/m.25234 type:complete len:107 (+) Transcript_20832:80-400(+)